MIGIGNQGADLCGIGRSGADFHPGKWAGAVIQLPGANAWLPCILELNCVEKEMDVMFRVALGKVLRRVFDAEVGWSTLRV